MASTKKSDPVDVALENVLKHEGGYQASRSDKGNFNSKGELVGTKYGISAPVLEARTGSATPEQMRKLSKADALEIYKSEYVPAVTNNLGISPDSPAFSQALDIVVNHGYGNAVPIIQRAVGAKVDGKSGPGTRKAIQSLDQNALAQSLSDSRKKFYQGIVKSNPDQSKFLKGWMRRADSFAPKTSSVE